MANEYSVIYLDDERNAGRPVLVDNRGMPVRSPGGFWPRVAAPRVAYAQPMQAMQTQPQPTVIYHQAPAKPSVLAGMTVAELVDMGAQLLAAIQPLPAAPTAAGELETDVENMVIYQTALATHAKRDEQLRTLGSLLGRLLRK